MGRFLIRDSILRSEFFVEGATIWECRHANQLQAAHRSIALSEADGITRRSPVLMMLWLLLAPLASQAAPRGVQESSLDSSKLVRVAVGKLVKMQEVDGEWPYDIIFHESKNKASPHIGFRVAVAAIVAQTLLTAAPDDRSAQAAVQRGLAYVLTQLHHSGMASDNEFRWAAGFDFRVFGQAFALEFLCHVRARKTAGVHEAAVAAGIPRLVQALIQQEISAGGWSYTSGFRSLTHVTAPVTQALLTARSQGENIPDAIFQRARGALEMARSKEGAFAYEGLAGSRSTVGRAGNSLPGSPCRSLAGETTLLLLNAGSISSVQAALDNFYKYWNELEARRRKPGTHEGPYNIAPYYFYYGHRYAAQAIQMLPVKDRVVQRNRLWKLLLQTRDKDGTWNDLTTPNSCTYGTAMAVLVLLGDKVPLPPKLPKR